MMLLKTLGKIALMFALLPFTVFAQPSSLSLNGLWEAGENRKYDTVVRVPGLYSAPQKINEQKVWYKRTIKLPGGSWNNAHLTLKGARFMPEVFVNGQSVSKKPGGMAPTVHTLRHPDVKPGAEVVLEIALTPLSEVPADDASRIPGADHWRSNVSSCLWDDVMLEFAGNSVFEKSYPYADTDSDFLRFHYRLSAPSGETKTDIKLQLVNKNDVVILQKQFENVQTAGRLDLFLNYACRLWTPEDPEIYRLVATVYDNKKPSAVDTINYGHRKFETAGKKFLLNNTTTTLRAGTVVWHRWLRDPEAPALAWNEEWFAENIIERMKNPGANTLRFHLGMPPERFLDLCDKMGVMVQAEWTFFHGIKASSESMKQQWDNWFALCMRHPSVVLLHAWNETEGPDELKKGFEALESVAAGYPPLVLAHRDVLHVHKYWWSLFENVGLYYDSFEEFDKPVMADEFGGNYLDGKGNIGMYPTNAGSFARFLGRNHTVEERLRHQALANAKMAEYWRRIGVAGFSPFCFLGSPEDGNHWFMGPLEQAKPKPVWAAMRSAWAPVSISLNMWDRHFFPSQVLEVGVTFFNESSKKKNCVGKIEIFAGDSARPQDVRYFTQWVDPGKTVASREMLKLPKTPGHYTLRATLQNPTDNIKDEIVTEWDIDIIKPQLNSALLSKKIAVLPGNEEIETALKAYGAELGAPDNKTVSIIIGGKSDYEKLKAGGDMSVKMEKWIKGKKNIILTDAGPQYLGQGYDLDKTEFIQSPKKVFSPKKDTVQLPFGTALMFVEAAEPESHIFPSLSDSSLFAGLSKEAGRLWNGYRGGLIVPAADMYVSGLSKSAVLETWKARGAEPEKIKSPGYFAYELEGFYKFSTEANDNEVVKNLKAEVEFLATDAPALKNRINTAAGVKITDLHQLYQQAGDGKAKEIIPMASCGRDLVKTPVYKINYGKGSLTVSQLMMSGRLVPKIDKPHETASTEVKPDPAALQMLFNMINAAGVK